jgi:hypothetical protein
MPVMTYQGLDGLAEAALEAETLAHHSRVETVVVEPEAATQHQLSRRQGPQTQVVVAVALVCRTLEQPEDQDS